AREGLEQANANAINGRRPFAVELVHRIHIGMSGLMRLGMNIMFMVTMMMGVLMLAMGMPVFAKRQFQLHFLQMTVGHHRQCKQALALAQQRHGLIESLLLCRRSRRLLKTDEVIQRRFKLDQHYAAIQRHHQFPRTMLMYMRLRPGWRSAAEPRQRDERRNGTKAPWQYLHIHTPARNLTRLRAAHTKGWGAKCYNIANYSVNQLRCRLP